MIGRSERGYATTTPSISRQHVAFASASQAQSKESNLDDLWDLQDHGGAPIG